MTDGITHGFLLNKDGDFNAIDFPEAVSTEAFGINAGGDFDRQYFTATALLPSVTRKTAEVVAGEQFNVKLSDRVSLSEAFNFFPNTSSTEDFRYQLDATAATKVKNWLSWQVTYSSRYLSNPLPGFRNNDVLLSTGLRLTVGKGVF